MPVYDYECGQCAHKFEQRRSFSEGATATCPCCQSKAKRVFAPVPIHFKGSGFYVTDSRKNGPSEEKISSHKSTGSSATASKSDSSASKN
jgi:putative FmdB family regulatory protein